MYTQPTLDLPRASLRYLSLTLFHRASGEWELVTRHAHEGEPGICSTWDLFEQMDLPEAAAAAEAIIASANGRFLMSEGQCSVAPPT